MITKSSAKAKTLKENPLTVMSFMDIKSRCLCRRASSVNIKSRGNKGHPCQVPLLTKIGSDNSPFIKILVDCFV